jgi:hypothetical protein
MKRILLYSSRETCTYTGDANPFPHSEGAIASAPSGHDSPVGSGRWIPRRLGESRTQLDAAGAPASRAQPRVPLDHILQALTFHVTQGTGTLAEHFFELFQEPLANSSWSDRRIRVPWEIFANLMRRALRPLATRRHQPDAFWRGWRLLALDGTQYSVTNTPQVAATTTKAVSRRFCELREGGEVAERQIRTERKRFQDVFGNRPKARILIEPSTESEWIACCLTSSGRHLRIFLSEISSREEIDEMLHGRIGVMIRFLDLRWLRGSILGSVLKERVR